MENFPSNITDKRKDRVGKVDCKLKKKIITKKIGWCDDPNDKRYTHLIGKRAIVPLVNREIPIITKHNSG